METQALYSLNTILNEIYTIVNVVYRAGGYSEIPPFRSVSALTRKAVGDFPKAKNNLKLLLEKILSEEQTEINTEGSLLFLDTILKRHAKTMLNRLWGDINLFAFISAKGMLTKYIDTVNKVLNTAAKQEKNHFKKLGLGLSPVFYSFVLWIIEYTRLLSFDKVYYFTREGTFFKKIHDKIFPTLSKYKGIPTAKLLEVSRRALFAASLEEGSLKEIDQKLWSVSHYKRQSLQDLFKSLSIDTKPYEKLFQKYNLPKDEKIDHPANDSRMHLLFRDSYFRRMFKKDLTQKRKEALRYFKTKGFPTKGRVAISDIGYGGSIQKFLGYLFPNLKIYGFYLALDHFASYGLPNVIKEAFLIDVREEGYPTENRPFWESVGLLEFLTLSNKGSVRGYQNGKALREDLPEEVEKINTFVQDFQKGVIQGAQEVANIYTKYWISPFLMKETAKRELFKFFILPDKQLVDVYFRFKHEENFGVGKVIDRSGVKLEIRRWLRALLSYSERRKLLEYIWSWGWANGVFIKLGLPFLNKYYNRKYRSILENEEIL